MWRETRIFFPEFNIRLYDKHSESDYFCFPPPKSEYFFQQHWESQFFLERNHNPPPPPPPPLEVKWSALSKVPPLRHMRHSPIFAILLIPFGALAPNDLSIICLFNRLTRTVPVEVCSRNESCELNWISTFLFTCVAI